MNRPNMTLDVLADELRDAKARLGSAKAAVAAAERNILDHPDVVALKRDEGTVHVGPVTVSFGLTRKWDQEKLAELATKVNPAFFPFRTDFKEDLRATRAFQKAFPDLVETLEAALTQTPRKPSVKVATGKQEAA